MSEEKNCTADADKELSLPNGFCATIFADKVGHARQLAVTPDGTVYVNTWSGLYYGNDTPPAGGFLIALKDTKSSGHADVNVRFGPTVADGAEDEPAARGLHRDRGGLVHHRQNDAAKHMAHVVGMLRHHELSSLVLRFANRSRAGARKP